MQAELAFLSGVALLLPVAAVSGWYVGRRNGDTSPPAAPRSISSEYFRGINYLLNEQHDKAIEVFVKVLELEDEAIDTHLALGNLFRRRGEVDRAIRVHQNIIARPGLTPVQRAHAMLELGLDYKRSGLLDRAENLFLDLVESEFFTLEALRNLLDIYQQERDWNRALDYAERLEREQGEDTAQLQAQFLCELADEMLREGRDREAESLLARAARADGGCVRANLMRANILISHGEYRRAIGHLKAVESQDPAFLSETIEPLEVCYRALNRRDEFIAYLKQLAEHHLGITPVLTLAELELEQRGPEEAMQVIVDELHARPTVRGVDKLLEYWLAKSAGEAREGFSLVKNFTSRLLEQRFVYKCGSCGFTGRTLHWQCPSCKRWDTVRPIRGLEGE